MKEQDIKKLRDVGATEQQAEAALAAIEDVNEAIEAFLCGVFDDVGGTPVKRTKTSNDAQASPSLGARQKSIDLTGEDEWDDEGSGELDALSDALQESCTNYNFDPYHGVEFSKDRKETIVDTVEKPKTVHMQGRAEPQDKLKQMACTEITAGQWMSGVPIGSEQSYFLEAYQKLAMLDVRCPHCSHAVPRKSGQLLAVWPTIFAFLDHLSRILNHRCSSCGACFCIACGKKPLSPARRTVTTRAQVAEVQKAPDNGVASHTLLHCSLVASLIMGAGLIQLEGMVDKASVAQGDAATAAAAPQPKAAKPVNSYAAMYPDMYDCEDCSDPECCGGMSRRKERPTGGVGYAGSATDDYKWQENRAKLQKDRDELIRHSLEQLRPYLPDHNRSRVLDANGQVVACDPTEEDFLPDIVLIAHLRRRFLPLASELLESRSISDVTERAPLFEELLRWFGLLGQHPNLAALVAQPIMRRTKIEWRDPTTSNTSGSGDRSSKVSNKKVEERVQTYVASASPRELAQSLVDQTQILLKGIKTSMLDKKGTETTAAATPAKGRKKKSPARAKSAAETAAVEKDEEYDRVLAFCRSIIDSIATLDRALKKTKGDEFYKSMMTSFGVQVQEDKAKPVGGGAVVTATATAGGSGERPLSKHQQQALYQEWAKTAVFDEADMTVAVSTGKSKSSTSPSRVMAHTFDKAIKASENLQNSKRNLIIAKEVAGLRSSLPAEWDHAVFVRVDTSRIDVMKALIVGPPCSPYKNGVFAFDLFLPEMYKSVPPNVKLTTTDSGKVRFGPNLYANGSVCLSLLGTWSGPGWQSDSTVLQVLLSITSMVMGLEEPCVNEPGWERYRGTKTSKAYSKNLRRQTVRVAMKQMLERPPHPWEDVIKEHFRLKKTAIDEQLDEWLKEDDNGKTVGDGACMINGYSTAPGAQGAGDSEDFKANVDAVKALLAEL